MLHVFGKERGGQSDWGHENEVESGGNEIRSAKEPDHTKPEFLSKNVGFQVKKGGKPLAVSGESDMIRFMSFKDLPDCICRMDWASAGVIGEGHFISQLKKLTHMKLLRTVGC